MNSPAVNGEALELSVRRLWHEWLASWFDGAAHVLSNPAQPVVFPAAAIAFGQGGITQPLETADVGGGTVSRGRVGGVAELVLAQAHGLAAGATVRVAGVGGTGYNGTFTLSAVPAATALRYACTGADEATTPDVGGQVMQGPGVEIRAIIRASGAKSLFQFDTHQVHEVGMASDFWVRAAVRRTGEENSAHLAQTVADLLVAVLTRPAAVLGLAEKGVTHIRTRFAREVPMTNWATRIVTATWTAWYEVH